MTNVDLTETRKFDELARRWWDQEGDFKPLHRINPLRLGYIQDRVDLTDAPALDVGCGGGILAESMVRAGAVVTGLDLAAKPLQVARLHALEAGLEIEYLSRAAEDLAEERPEQYAVVTCLETLEHVPDPARMVKACADLLRPGGHLFLSTINRNPKAYALAVIGAEYILKMLPKGTHDYRKFIKPSELAGWLRAADLQLRDITGMTFNPLTGVYKLSRDTDVNYLVHAVKP